MTNGKYCNLMCNFLTVSSCFTFVFLVLLSRISMNNIFAEVDTNHLLARA